MKQIEYEYLEHLLDMIRPMCGETFSESDDDTKCNCPACKVSKMIDAILVVARRSVK